MSNDATAKRIAANERALAEYRLRHAHLFDSDAAGAPNPEVPSPSCSESTWMRARGLLPAEQDGTQVFDSNAFEPRRDGDVVSETTINFGGLSGWEVPTVVSDRHSAPAVEGDD